MKVSMLLCLILSTLMFSMVSSKAHCGFISYTMNHIVAKDGPMAAHQQSKAILLTQAHSPTSVSFKPGHALDDPSFNINKFNHYCNFEKFEQQVQCFTMEIGAPLTNHRNGLFLTKAASTFSKLFVGQRFAYRYLPQDKLDEFLPKFFKLYRGVPTQNAAAQVAQEVKDCKNGFVFHWFDTSKYDVENKQNFKYYGQMFAADCRNKQQITLIIFNGFRRGYFRELGHSDSDKDFVKSFSKDTSLYVIGKHFGMI